MKRIILSLSLLSVVCSAYSQFNVTADGSASITTYNGEHAFSATHSIYGINGGSIIISNDALIEIREQGGNLNLENGAILNYIKGTIQ